MTAPSVASPTPCTGLNLVTGALVYTDGDWPLRPRKWRAVGLPGGVRSKHFQPCSSMSGGAAMWPSGHIAGTGRWLCVVILFSISFFALAMSTSQVTLGRLGFFSGQQNQSSASSPDSHEWPSRMRDSMSTATEPTSSERNLSGISRSVASSGWAEHSRCAVQSPLDSKTLTDS